MWWESDIKVFRICSSSPGLRVLAAACKLFPSDKGHLSWLVFIPFCVQPIKGWPSRWLKLVWTIQVSSCSLTPELVCPVHHRAFFLPDLSDLSKQKTREEKEKKPQGPMDTSWVNKPCPALCEGLRLKERNVTWGSNKNNLYNLKTYHHWQDKDSNSHLYVWNSLSHHHGLDGKGGGGRRKGTKRRKKKVERKNWMWAFHICWKH